MADLRNRIIFDAVTATDTKTLSDAAHVLHPVVNLTVTGFVSFYFDGRRNASHAYDRVHWVRRGLVEDLTPSTDEVTFAPGTYYLQLVDYFEERRMVLTAITGTLTAEWTSHPGDRWDRAVEANVHGDVALTDASLKMLTQHMDDQSRLLRQIKNGIALLALKGGTLPDDND